MTFLLDNLMKLDKIYNPNITSISDPGTLSAISKKRKKTRMFLGGKTENLNEEI